MKLSIFYSEPDPDRFLPGDRYPRKIIRQLLRPSRDPGGMEINFINLLKGLDILGISYSTNDWSEIYSNPSRPIFLLGKPHLLGKVPLSNPVVYGPSIASHPSQDPLLLSRNIVVIMVACDWMASMYKRDLGAQIPVEVSPIGVDTAVWKPALKPEPLKLLVYDKVRWKRDYYEIELIEPVLRQLDCHSIQYEYLRYGEYREDMYKEALSRVHGVVFLCEHETQGFAYLQALSAGVPVLAWNRGGHWQDSAFFPSKVRFQPVISVPYFNPQCGEIFQCAHEFWPAAQRFIDKILSSCYNPRSFVENNLGLAQCAKNYLDLASKYI